MSTIIIYKPIGQTCSNLINELYKTNKYKTLCFTGRLDPMAHGQMLLLVDDETKNKTNYKNLTKTYKFKFIIGVSTDSTDCLGLFNNHHYNHIIDIEKIENYIKLIKLNNAFKQKYHNFSSFRPIEKYENKRKPLWWWSNFHPEISIANYTKDVVIHNISIDSINEINTTELQINIINNISKITDLAEEFRVPQILKQWTNFNIEHTKLIEFECTATVSSGFYIRQFVQDISNEYKVKLMVTEINRIKIN